MNSLVQAHRSQVPNDPRTDEQITLDYGDDGGISQLAERFPDFAAEYQKLAADRKEALTPSLGAEVGRGVSRGVDSLEATGYGAGALAAGSVGATAVRNFFLQRAQMADEDAAQNTPTVGSLEDIHGAGDAARYVAGKAGELAPNLAEAAATSAIGAVVGAGAGTAAEPGGGTVAGAAGGALYGLLERQAVKSLIRKGVVDGLEDLASAEGKSLLATETKNLGAKYGAELANTLNFWGQSAGGTYDKLARDPNVDPGTALNVSIFGGLAQAVPAQFLPSYVTSKFFGAEAPAVSGYFARLASEAAKVVPGGAAAMSLQELASIASEKYADPNTRDEAFDISQWSKTDRSRLLNASATGALAGLIGAPVAAIPGGKPTEDADGNPVKAPTTPTAQAKQDAVLSAYTGDQSTEHGQRVAEAMASLAVKDVNGALDLADTKLMDQFTPEERNAYNIIRANVARQNAEPTPEGDHSGLGAVTARLAQNPSPLAVHPELNDQEILEAMAPTPAKPVQANPQAPAEATGAATAPAASPTVGAAPLEQPVVAPTEPGAVNLVSTPAPTNLNAARAAATAALDPEAQEVRQQVANAAAQTDTTPTEAQKVAGNYAKGEVKIEGLPPIKIENPAGSTRSGVGPEGPWSVEMPAHYGYFKGEEGKDGDPVDVYIGPKPEGDKVFVVDQIDPKTGKFDEHKVMIGFDTRDQATAAYDAAFCDGSGSTRRGAVTETTKAGLKEWMDSGKAKEPFGPKPSVTGIPATAEPKVTTARIDFEDSTAVPQESKRGQAGGELKSGGIKKSTSVKEEPAYFEIKPEELADPKALGDRLTSRARSNDTKAAYQNTKRLTVVEDRQTGKVFLLSTFKEKRDGLARLADPENPGKNVKLADMLGRPSLDGGQRYTPIASMRLGDTEKGLVQEYPDRAAYEQQIGQESRQRMGEIARAAEAAEAQHAALMAERGKGSNLNADTEGTVSTEQEPGETDEEAAPEAAAVASEPTEGFGEEHAQALFNIFGGEDEPVSREKFEDLLSDALPESRRAVSALRTAVESVMDRQHLAPKEAFEVTKEKLYEAVKAGDKDGKQAFSDALVHFFGLSSGAGEARTAEAVPEGVGQRAAERQPEGPQGNAVPNNPAVISFRKPEGVQEVTDRHAALLDSIHEAAVRGGLSVERIGQDLTGLTGQFSKQTGAAYDSASRTIAQVVADTIGREDIVTSLHEVAHDVFARLPDQERAQLLRAIDQLSDRALGTDVSVDPRIRQSNPAGLQNIGEERLVEATALKLTDQGFDPNKARGLAQQFVRALKDLFLKAAMSVQRALFGEQFTSPTLARKYFENKVRSFLAGDFQRSSFIDMLGGGNPSEAKRASWHATGQAIAERINDQGAVDYDHVPDTSMAAAGVNNLVFRRPDASVVEDPHRRTVEIEKRAALFNHQLEMFGEAAKHPALEKLAADTKSTPDKVLLGLLNLTDPMEMKHGLESALETDKSPVQYDQNQKIGGFKGESNKADVTRKAYLNVQSLLGKVAGVKSRALESIASLTRIRESRLEAYEAAKAEHASWESATSEATREMRKEGNRLFGAIKGESKRQGVIEQQLKAIDPLATVKKYAPQFQKLFTGDELKGERLGTILDKFANDPTIDFSKPIGQIRKAMEANPEYSRFVQDTPESKALVATVVGFAKTHARVMANLELRRLQDGQKRAEIVRGLDELKAEKGDFLTSLRELGKTAKLQERVRQAYRQKLQEVRSLGRRIQKNHDRVTAADALTPILSKEQSRLAGLQDIGTDAVWRHDMPYNVPESPTTDPASILASVKRLNLDTSKGLPTNPEEVEGHLRQMSAFLQEREARYAAGDENAKDNLYQGIKRQRDEIAANKNFRVNVTPAQRFMTTLNLLPVGKRIAEAFGTPAARMIDQMVNHFTSEHWRMRPDVERMGRRNDQLEDVLLKMLPQKKADAREYLRQYFLNPAKRLMQHQDDLEEIHAGNPTALKSAIYNRVMTMLRNNDATGPYIRGREAEWRDGLTKLLEFQHESNKFLLAQVKKAGLGVADPRLKVINPATGERETAVRQHIPQGAYTFSQKMASGFRTMVDALRNSGWKLAPDEFSKLGEAYNSGPDGPQKARQIVSKYFNHEQHGDQVRNHFFADLAQMDTESPFDAPKLGDGVTRSPADIANVIDAYRSSGQDPVKFAEDLFDLHGGQRISGLDGGPDIQNKGTYVQDVLSKMAEIANEADSIMAKTEADPNDQTVSIRGMTGNAMIDARSIDHLPGQWFDYHSFDQRDLFKTVERIASQTAFGREQERLASAFDTVAQESSAAQLKLKEARSEAQRSNPSADPKAIEKAVQAKLGKAEYDRVTAFSKRAKLVQDSVKDLSSYFRRDNAPDGTLQWMVRSSHLLGALMVNQPSSAIALMAQLVDMNLRYGASRSVLGATVKTIGAAGKEIAGSLAQAVGLQMFNGGEYHQMFNDLGLNDPAAVKRWHDAFDRLQGEGPAAHAFRAANDLLGTGINPLGDKATHTILKPGQIFNTAAVVVNKAVTEGIWHLTGQQVMRGMEFYRSNLEKFNDPTFKLNADTLKLRGADRDSFTRLTNDLDRWGMNYDDMVRGAMQRGDKTVLSKEEALRLYSMGLSEVALESNLSTMPAAAYNNSIIRIALPLLGWSFRRMQQVGSLHLNTEGQRDMKALARGIAGLAVVSAGGLALSALIDQYYQKLIGKERDLTPSIGPNGISAMGVLENLNRIGTLGFFGELANGVANVGQGGDNRMLSVDQRVLAVSSAMSIQQAISSWINQGFNADYAHVVRPLAGAVGGGGLIQYMQLANNAFGLDNLEARVTARINAQNYLRVVGRQLQMDVRTSDGGYSSPTPISPYLTAMELAAYKNSPADFQQAYNAAIREAKESGQSDPVDYVKRAFSGRNPLKTIFRTALTQQDYERLLANMPGSGREDVSQAVNLYNEYATRIGGKPFDGKPEKPVTTKAAPISAPKFSLGDFRQRAAMALQ